MARIRVDIDIDDDCVQRIMDRYQLRTKTEAVDLALRTLAQPMTLEEAQEVEGSWSIGHVPVDDTPHVDE
ncbi:MAG TPA: type II toxin-antitoxin system VapB family antitoxin [Acidimicrobiales bacterium]|nr:type II toxin-antitoxin system VapB family antitoxin [Acidimicrobiales bacterium]